MTMKRIINKAALLFIGALALTSCSDWLDYEPKDKQTEEQQFATRAGFYSAVNGTYNMLASNSLYGKNLSWGAVDLLSKRYQVATSNTSSSCWAKTYPDFTDPSAQSVLESVWTSTYNAILNANLIIDNVDKNGSVLTETDKALIKGDMLAMRAMLHLDLLRLFGLEPVTNTAIETPIIPYNDKPTAEVYEKLSAKDVVAKVVKDLNDAEILLSVDPVIKEGRLSTADENATDNYQRYRQLRVNYYAIAVLKARAYMWIGDYTNALAEAKKITDDANVKEKFPWVDSSKLLGNQVNPDRVFSTEVLFGIYNRDRADIFTYNFDAQGLNYGASFLGPRANYIKNYLFKSDQQGDYRYQSQWIDDAGYDVLTKFKAISYSASNPPFYAFLMPLVRISEAYYIAAECLRKTNKAKAVEYLNVVKKNRGTILLDETNVTDAGIMAELGYEYIREFIAEGQVLYFFKRANAWKYGANVVLNSEYNGASAAMIYFRDSETTPPVPASELSSR